MRNEASISDMIAVVLIICLGLILTIIVFGLFFGYFPLQQKSAYMLPEFGNQSISGKNSLIVFHRGGDAVYLNSTGPGTSRLGIYLDTASGSYQVQPLSGVTMFRPGTTLYIYNTTAGYRLTDTAGTLIAATALGVTACPLSIRLVDESAKILIARWNWTCTPTGPAPTVSSLSNTTGYRGWPVIESITGTNFLIGATAKFNGTGLPDIPASSCTYISPTGINCTFDLLEKTAATYNVVVTNPDGKSGMKKSAFILSSPNPTITSSTPVNGSQATTVTITNLAGTNFQPGAKVDYYLGGTRINLTSVNVISRTQITGTLVIPPSVPAGSYGINITNTDNKSGQSTGRFAVLSTTPSITARSPITGNRGWPVTMTITGTNFVTGATTHLNRSGSADITGTSVSVISPTQITCTFDLKGAAAGAWNISVTNPDGRGASQLNYFTVNSPTPTITSSTPATGYRGATVPITLLQGTYFQPGATVVYSNGSTVMTISDVTVVSPTAITGTLAIPSSAPAGTYNITVTNTDAKTVTGVNAFRVYADAPPIVTGINPIQGARGVLITPVFVTGAGFQAGARVRLYNGTTLLYTAPLGTVTATQITTSFTVPAGVIPNTSNVRVTNVDGQYASLPFGYRIL